MFTDLSKKKQNEILDCDSVKKVNSFVLRRSRRWSKEILKGKKTLERYTIVPAQTPQEFADSMSLVFDFFIGSNNRNVRRYGLPVKDYFKPSADLVTFVAKELQSEKIVGTLSIVSDSKIGLPCESTFGKDIRKFSTKSKYIVESTGFVIHPEHSNTALSCEISRYVLGWSIFAGCDSAFVAVSPTIRHFFTDVLLFDQIADERSYSSRIYDPVIGLWCNPQKTRAKAEQVDEALGEDAFLVDYLFETNPVTKFVENPGIKGVLSAYHDMVAEALTQYLAQFCENREEKKVVHS